MCSSEVPDLNQYVERYEGENFVLYGINVQEPYHQVETFLEARGGVNYDVLLDADGNAQSSYEFQAQDSYAPYPRQYIIDQQGVVRYMASQYYPDALTETIDGLLGIDTSE